MRYCGERQHEAFSKNNKDIGRTQLIEMEIDTGDSLPVAQSPYTLPLKHYEWVRQEIETLEKSGVIERSLSRIGVTSDCCFLKSLHLTSHREEDLASIIGRSMHCSQKLNEQTRVHAVYHSIRYQKSTRCSQSWEVQQFSLQ